MNLRQHKRRAYVGMQVRFLSAAGSWFGRFPATGWAVHLCVKRRVGDCVSIRRRRVEDVVAMWIAQNGPLPDWIARAPREMLLSAIFHAQDLGAHDPFMSGARALIDRRIPATRARAAVGAALRPAP